MILREGLEHVPPGRRAVAIGSFDGVHLGHRRVIAAAVEAAADHALVSAVVTFQPHPMRVLRPEQAPDELSTIERQAELAALLGPDELVVIAFDHELSQMSAEQFGERVVAGILGARRVFVGGNFRYGHRAAGSVATLTEQGRELGFEVTVVPMLEVDGAPVSSSRIRALLAAGDVAAAARLLGRAPWVEGTVVRGDGRGRQIGVPTANVQQPAHAVRPAIGIYAGRAHLAGEDHPAAISVGRNPTFPDDARAVRVEAHLLDFDRDIYGEPIRVEFGHRLRDELRFDSVEELVAQMRRDIQRARELTA